MQKRVAAIESGNFPYVKDMKLQLNDLEQYSRRNNLEIHGMVKEDNENLFEKLNDLACKLDLPKLTDSTLESVHRVPARPGKDSVVIARFSSSNLKDK